MNYLTGLNQQKDGDLSVCVCVCVCVCKTRSGVWSGTWVLYRLRSFLGV